jgi:sugar lactone lactonase YvrE
MQKNLFRAIFSFLPFHFLKFLHRSVAATFLFGLSYTMSAQTGIISTIAGNGTAAYRGDGGAATSAELNRPYQIAMDSNGNLYIADSANNRIRKVTPAGVISTVAGDGMLGYSGDGGPAVNAHLWSPYGVAVDSSGNLYIADTDNYRIRKVDSSGVISTVAGTGSNNHSGDGGPATSAAVYPTLLAFDSNGNLYFTENGAYRIREINTSGIVTTVAGNGIQGSNGDGGLATSAELNDPGGLTVDSNGNLYIAEVGVLTGNPAANGRIRQVTPTGFISTVAGAGTGGVTLFDPEDIALDSSGNLYIADSNNERILMMPPGRTATVIVAGTTGVSGFSGDGGSATAAKLWGPVSITLDSTGNLYISDYANQRIRKVTF